MLFPGLPQMKTKNAKSFLIAPLLELADLAYRLRYLRFINEGIRVTKWLTIAVPHNLIL